jgi:hypothetical protein
MWDASEIASMCAEIDNSIPKHKSRFKDRPGFSEKWDRMEADMVAMRKAMPGVAFDIPNEIPDIRDDGLSPKVRDLKTRL